MVSASDPRVLDLAHLARQTFGDGDLEREVLGLFEEQCARLLPLVAAGGSRAADAAHTLKGAARAIGAWQVAAICGSVEEVLGGDRPADPLQRLVGQLEGAVAAARAAIAERWRRLPEPALANPAIMS